jgi:hypothetical protein
MVGPADQPTILREKRSITTAKYNQLWFPQSRN